MLVQSSSYCRSGIEVYVDKIMGIVEMAFEQHESAIYKSGGTFLHALIEGLTSIKMKFDTGNGVD